MIGTFDEWFTAELARTINDGEVVFHGFASPCAQVAMHLAKRSHAPNMLLVEGAMYAVDPVPDFIPRTGNDLALKKGSVYSMRFEEFFDASVRGDVDRMFVSGVQIDRFGNTNVTAIGGMPTPKVKMGGGGGGCNMSATVKHLTLWTSNHRSGRCLVDKCDFITDFGHRSPAGTREELGFTGGGPERLVSDLGVFDFDNGEARLVKRFPDVDLDEIADRTGFGLVVADHVSLVEPPDAETISLIRAIDPLGVRKSEFSSRELARDLSS